MNEKIKMVLIIENEIIEAEITQYLKNRFDTYNIESNIILVSQSEKQESDSLMDINLKPKESQVLELLKNGMSYTEIAQKLSISINGVRYYVKRIYAKLGVSNSRAAINTFYKNV